jgi:hypothetical protein
MARTDISRFRKLDVYSGVSLRDISSFPLAAARSSGKVRLKPG